MKAYHQKLSALKLKWRGGNKLKLVLSLPP